MRPALKRLTNRRSTPATPTMPLGRHATWECCSSSRGMWPAHAPPTRRRSTPATLRLGRRRGGHYSASGIIACAHQKPDRNLDLRSNSFPACRLDESVLTSCPYAQVPVPDCAGTTAALMVAGLPEWWGSGSDDIEPGHNGGDEEGGDLGRHRPEPHELV